MQELIDFIEAKKKAASQNQDRLSLQKLDFMANVVSWLRGHDMENRIEKIIPLEDMQTGYYEYRLMNDCESDNRSLWMEYKTNGTPLRLDAGDIIIKLKNHAS